MANSHVQGLSLRTRVHVMTIVRSAPSIITPATPHHPPPASA